MLNSYLDSDSKMGPNGVYFRILQHYWLNYRQQEEESRFGKTPFTQTRNLSTSYTEVLNKKLCTENLFIGLLHFACILRENNWLYQ